MRFFFLILLPLILSCSQEKTEVPAYPASAARSKEKIKTSKKPIELKEGDLIFQSTSGGQGRAIQIATGSLYSHVGIIFKRGKELVVYEAVQPVRVTPLKQFIARGDNDHYVIKRLKKWESLLSPQRAFRDEEDRG